MEVTSLFKFKKKVGKLCYTCQKTLLVAREEPQQIAARKLMIISIKPNFYEPLKASERITTTIQLLMMIQINDQDFSC